ncbi:MAG: RagB/SusD family nutrient uptake outer membrane protein [Bacteroidota bacterium]
MSSKQPIWKKHSLIPALLVMAFLSGCLSTDPPTPREQLRGEILQFQADPETAGYGFLANAYEMINSLHDYTGIFAIQDASTDVAMGHKSPAWDEGGIWANLHRHSWGSGNGTVEKVWSELVTAKATIQDAQIIFDLSEVNPETDAIRYEAAALLSLVDFYLIDLFGQVVDRDSLKSPIVYTRAEATDRAIERLEDAIPKMGDKYRFQDERILFRMNTNAARILLARLYLNRGVYNGTGSFAELDLARVFTLGNDIINTFQYDLADDYWDNFRLDNLSRTQVDDELVLTTSVGSSGRYASIVLNQPHTQSAWGGFSTIAEFYNSFDPNDPRFKGPRIPGLSAHLGFNVGYQLDDNGDTLRYSDGSPVFYNADVSPDPQGLADGARPIKYETNPDSLLNGPSENVQVIFRLAEGYLLRAEAQFRDGRVGEALTTINTLRNKRGVPALTSLSEEDILREYGYEFWWEGQRRTHLIRFGKFLEPYQTRPQSSPSERLLFPIPISALASNPFLQQNPGY